MILGGGISLYEDIRTDRFMTEIMIVIKVKL